MNNINGVYVYDFDDVLINLSILMYQNIRENWRIYKKYFWDPGELTTKEVQERRLFHMNEWLIHKKFSNLSSEEYSGVSLKIWETFIKTFFNKPGIYDNSEPTKFAKRTIMNPAFIESPNVSEVIILSRNVTEIQNKSKMQFISKYFNHPKIKTITVKKHESKAEALIENNINFNVFVDDELPNIRDVAETFRDNLNGKNFIIPRYGYNENIPKELKFLIEDKGGTVTYYNPF